MRDVGDPLTWLQHADSFFPSGAVSFSWGLETLAGEGRIGDATDVAAFLHAHLRGRWATVDRAATIAAYRAVPDLDRVADIDNVIDAQTLAEELRDGSRRIGRALIEVHLKIRTRHAGDYRKCIEAGRAPGHAPVVQGLVWQGAGMSEMAVDATSAHQLCLTILGAALRIGLIGHISAQTILTEARPVVHELLSMEPPAIEDMRAFTPEAEIAAMRHETQDSRLFAN